MHILLNNKSVETTDGITLSAFMESLGYTPNGIAVAINNTVIPKSNWATTVLVNEQNLLLIRAVSGG